MAYQIAFEYLKALPKLLRLRQDKPQIVEAIEQELERLAIQHEDFVTGEPSVLRMFIVESETEKIRVIYRIGHTIKIIDVIAIEELPT